MLRLLLFLLALVSHLVDGSAYGELSPQPLGDTSCPCLPWLAERANGTSSSGANERYGFGCNWHDLDTGACSNCNKTDCPSWCNRAWCWVDQGRCDLLNQRSKGFDGKWYSYATCNYIDSFEEGRSIELLSGKKIRVAFMHNAGGWKGAYNIDQQHFQGPLEDWSGPLVDFTREAARVGNFTIELQEPFPPMLINRSSNFWGIGSPNIVDHCIYAASLGLVHFCVSTMMMTNSRTSVVPWFKIFQANHFLIGMDDSYDTSHGRKGLLSTLTTIFLPLRPSTWLFVVLFVVPVLGLLFILHEYGGPQFPKKQTMVQYTSNGRQKQIYVQVPMRRYFWKSIYKSCLSLLEGHYDKLTIRTLGGKIHLLGLSVFILAFISVYVASLTAILTNRVHESKVQTLDDVVHAGYRICTIRSVYQSLKERYKLPDAMFVVDPPEEGGDGRPGFACRNCARGKRVLDFLDPALADHDDRYCHVAVFGPAEVHTRQSRGEHCNKTLLGRRPLVRISSGIPIYSGVSDELATLFFHMMHDGAWTRATTRWKPRTKCRRRPIDQTDFALTRMELTGIWIISLFFCVAGLTVTLFLKGRPSPSPSPSPSPTSSSSSSSSPTSNIKMTEANVFDQKGNMRSRLERHDSLSSVRDLLKQNEIRKSLRSMGDRPRSSYSNFSYSPLPQQEDGAADPESGFWKRRPRSMKQRSFAHQNSADRWSTTSSSSRQMNTAIDKMICEYRASSKRGSAKMDMHKKARKRHKSGHGKIE